MKCLVIHPEDETTTFLKVIYTHLKKKTVITGNITKSELRTLIEVHDQVLMLGHGSPSGLFSNSGSYIIDGSIVNSLRCKTNSIFIWCNAEEFIQRHGLSGLFSGMFVSEFDEALYCGIWDVDSKWITESNNGFSSICSKYINEPIDVLYKNLWYEYGVLAKTNPIAKFNHERLFLKLPNTPTYGRNKIHTEL